MKDKNDRLNELIDKLTELEHELLVYAHRGNEDCLKNPWLIDDMNPWQCHHDNDTEIDMILAFEVWRSINGNLMFVTDEIRDNQTIGEILMCNNILTYQRTILDYPVLKKLVSNTLSIFKEIIEIKYK